MLIQDPIHGGEECRPNPDPIQIFRHGLIHQSGDALPAFLGILFQFGKDRPIDQDGELFRLHILNISDVSGRFKKIPDNRDRPVFGAGSVLSGRDPFQQLQRAPPACGIDEGRGQARLGDGRLQRLQCIAEFFLRSHGTADIEHEALNGEAGQTLYHDFAEARVRQRYGHRTDGGFA